MAGAPYPKPLTIHGLAHQIMNETHVPEDVYNVLKDTVGLLERASSGEQFSNKLSESMESGVKILVNWFLHTVQIESKEIE